MSMYSETELEEEVSKPGDEADEENFDSSMEPFNPSDIDIAAEPKSLDLLIERISEGEIDMNTDFQRHSDLWDNRKMSRLIESILIRLPITPFYFDASDDDKWLIVDGLQRLSTIKKFVIDNNLRLRGLEFLNDLTGSTYEQLPRKYKRRIKEYPITILQDKTRYARDVKYIVFRRINTGGLILNNQEIRNALAPSEVRELLKELTRLEASRTMLGDLSKRMRDQELVLRFWAFFRFDYLDPSNKKEMASFLDRAMEEIKQGDTDYKKNFKKIFAMAIERCLTLLGENGFAKDPDEKPTFKNSTLFEVWMVTLAKINEEQFDKLKNNKSKFTKKVGELLKNDGFIQAISYSTQKRDHVELRYDKVDKLVSEVSND